MYFLPKPLEHVLVSKIYKECVEAKKDKTLREKLVRYESCVQMDADDYEKMVPGKIEAFLDRRELDEKTADQMAGLYKLLDSGKRKAYREAILAQTTMRACAICGRDHSAETLDHYLPKSKVPTMAVVPVNLIPCCQECNGAKSNQLPVKPEEALIHMYLDQLSEGDWLHARILFEEKPVTSFYVRCPEEWKDADILNSRLDKHMLVYKLYDRFSEYAGSELINLRNRWPKRYDKKNTEDVREYLQEYQENLKKDDRTQWLPALYRALEDNVEAFCGWLAADAEDGSR